jgi:hypothetical protein
MKKIKRLWIPVLLGVVLMIMLAGVASARPNARPQEQAWRVLTVPSSVCIPRQDGDDWYNHINGVYCESGGCVWLCAVDFPAAGQQAVGAVNVKRVTMFAYDNSGDAQAAWFYLWKTYPPEVASVAMATGTTTNSPAFPQTVMDTSVVKNPIYRVQGAHISATINGTGIEVYGFHVHYTWM